MVGDFPDEMQHITCVSTDNRKLCAKKKLKRAAMLLLSTYSRSKTALNSRYKKLHHETKGYRVPAVGDR